MKKLKKMLYEVKLINRSVPGLLIALLITSVIMMNILANKSLHTNIPYLALDCGILFSWITFFVMDIVVKRFGLKAANILTILGLITNLFFAIILLVCSFIPGEWSQSYVTGSEEVINNALDLTFRGSWYVLLGSSVAYLVSSIVNNVLNHFIGKKIDNNKGFKGFALRSSISTFIAQFIDNLVFALIVSLNFFGWSIVECITCALTGAILELILEMIFSPVAFKLCKKWENENVGIEYLEYINGGQNESSN